MRSGLVVVDKPAGWTSHDVVARLRRVYGQRRVGHAGTLDPDATGVLLVGLGRVTRLLRFLQETDKEYRGEVVFGIRPEHIALGAAAETSPIRTEITVEVIEPMGADTLIWTAIGTDPFRIRIDGQTRIAPGDRLTIGFDPACASLFDAKTENRL